MDHDHVLAAEQRIDPLHQLRHAVVSVDAVAGSPQVGGVEAKADVLDVVDGGQLHRVGEVFDAAADAVAAAGRRFEYQHRAAHFYRLGDARYAVDQAAQSFLSAEPAVRPDVDVDEARTVRRPHLQFADHRGDGLLVKFLIGASQVDQIRRMDRQRPDVQLGQAIAKRGEVGRQLGPPPPGGGVVGEELHRRGTDLVRPVGRFEQAGLDRQVRTDAAAGQGQRRWLRFDIRQIAAILRRTAND